MKTSLLPVALLTAIGLTALLGLLDTTRPPQKQLAVHGYEAGIRAYHSYIHPLTGRFIHCRYRPSCSSYSSMAVQRFGMVRGLRLTAARLWSCRPTVTPGTFDPVPDR